MLRIYNAIGSFVQDLNTAFGKKYMPVALYNRLIEKTTLRDTIAINRHINAFKNFFEQNPGYIKRKTLSNNVRITYSDRIYLDMSQILSKTDKENHQYIHNHLMTIYTLLNLGTKEGKKALQTLKEGNAKPKLDINLPNTNEGTFIKNTLNEMTEQFENMDTNTNPMQLMTNMMQSGFFSKFMGDLQTKMTSGEMDLRSLMGTVTSVIGEASPESGAEADQMRAFIGQSMSQMSMITGEDAPADIQQHMSSLFNAIGGGAMGGATGTGNLIELGEENVNDDGADADADADADAVKDEQLNEEDDDIKNQNPTI